MTRATPFVVDNDPDHDSGRDFVRGQKHYWRDADSDHYAWQTSGGYIAESEAALLDTIALSASERLLEIGCGEGANLHHLATRLGPSAHLFGIDFTPPKAHHAHARTGAHTVCADAARLPFADDEFDAVLIRDLLHHLPDPVAALNEARRVLRAGGRLSLIEPNGKNPLIAAMATLIRAERGMLVSSLPRLEAMVRGAGFLVVRVERRQALPISRVLLHYKFGVPSLGARKIVKRVLGRLERSFERLPPSLHAYFIIHGRKP